MNIVFAYAIQDGEEVKYAVAVFPSERSTILFAGGATKVRYTNGDTWNDFSAEVETINMLEGTEAVQYALQLRQRYIEEGTIAADPIPKPPPKTPLKFQK